MIIIKELAAEFHIELVPEHSNSISDEKALNGYPVLIHLLEGSGDNTFIDGIPADNETLFRTGDDFGIVTFKDFTFSDGEQINFKFLR